MIQFCSCTERSASTIKPVKSRRGLKSCNNCGRRLSIDGQEPLADSMLSSVGLELSRAIDPHLNWRTTTNTKKRAVRRARTSFSVGNLTIRAAGNFNFCDDLTHKYNEDMPVSEYEKVSVSVLGRRFNDALESVPIKKRRVIVSPSLSPELPLSDCSDRIVDASYDTSCSHSVTRKGKDEVNSIINSKLDLPGSQYDQHIIAENKSSKPYGSADFSGISILAAAACNSSIAGDFSNINFSISKGLPPEDGELPANSKSVDLENLPDTKVKQDVTSSDDLEDNNPSYAEELEVLGDEKSSTSMKDSNNHMQIEASSRSSRFHWDLNTVMEVWEGNSEEVIVNSNLCSTGSGKDSRSDCGRQENARPFAGPIGLGDGKDAPEAVGNGSRLALNMVSKSEVPGSEVAGGNLSGDNDREDAPRYGLSKADSRPGEVEAPLIMDAAEQKPCNEITFATKSDYLLDGNSHGSRQGSSGDASYSERAIAEESHSLENNDGLPYNQTLGHADPTDTELARSATAGISKGQGLAASDGGNINHDLEVGSTVDGGCLREPQSQKFTALSPVPSETDKDNQRLAATKHVHASADRNASQNDSPVSGVITEAAQVEPSGEKFNEARTTENSQEMDIKSRIYDLHMSSHDIYKTEYYGSTSAELLESENCVKIEDKNILKSKDSNASIPGWNLAIDISGHANDSPEFLMDDLTTRQTAEVHMSSVGVVSSLSGSKSSGDGHKRCSNENASEFYSHSDSSARDNEAEQAIGVKRIELDDDDQYEDGEFRESLPYGWVDGETEQVDYGSDNRETDEFEVAAEVACLSLHAENAESNMNLYDDCNEEEQLDYDDVHEDSSQQILKCLPGFEPHTVSGKKKNENVVENTSGSHVIEESQQLETNINATKELGKAKKESPNDGDAAGNLPRKELTRVKSSGWDRLPENCYGDSSRPHETLRRRPRSPPVMELPSRIGRPRISGISYRKDQYYPSRNRNGRNNDFPSDDERDGRDPRSIRREQSPLLGRGGDRGDQWMSSANYWRHNYRHDSPNFSGPNNYRRPVTNNAVAATIAKLESSGFVVGPDGTIIKAGIPRKHAPSVSQQRPMDGRVSPARKDGGYGMPLGVQKSRQMSPDRHVNTAPSRPGRYVPRMVNPSLTERYRRPLAGRSSRDESFSPPHGSPMHLSRSHTRSPSRSRSRSPRIWSSAKGRVDKRMSSGIGFRRRSRSPVDYKLPNRSDRVRFPYQRTVYSERIIRYTPPRD